MSKNLIRGVKVQGDRHDDGVAGHRVVHDGHDQAPTASADGDAIPSCADQAGQDAEGGDTVLVASHQPVQAEAEHSSSLLSFVDSLLLVQLGQLEVVVI